MRRINIVTAAICLALAGTSVLAVKSSDDSAGDLPTTVIAASDPYVVGSVTDLVNMADLTVSGRVVSEKFGPPQIDQEAGTTDHARITTIDVEEVLSGRGADLAAPQSLLVRDFGTFKYKDGPTRKMVTQGRPELAPGQSVILFLRASKAAPGMYNIMGDSAVYVTEGDSIVEDNRSVSSDLTKQLRKKAKSKLKDEIRAANLR